MVHEHRLQTRGPENVRYNSLTSTPTALSNILVWSGSREAQKPETPVQLPQDQPTTGHLHPTTHPGRVHEDNYLRIQRLHKDKYSSPNNKLHSNTEVRHSKEGGQGELRVGTRQDDTMAELWEYIGQHPATVSGPRPLRQTWRRRTPDVVRSKGGADADDLIFVPETEQVRVDSLQETSLKKGADSDEEQSTSEKPLVLQPFSKTTDKGKTPSWTSKSNSSNFNNVSKFYGYINNKVNDEAGVTPAVTRVTLMTRTTSPFQGGDGESSASVALPFDTHRPGQRQDFMTLPPNSHTSSQRQDYVTLPPDNHTSSQRQDYVTLPPNNHTSSQRQDYVTLPPDNHTSSQRQDYVTLPPNSQSLVLRPT
ncbi:hypothetical protein C0Q70_01311 [Pomacea canaliculata]|uniref:Uncharacterized protein n=1 Tax=Pomacea canaliculata TaxID=400727 RepID=A0A2T7PZ54_POMCA|nr:hypothetical protein C0Q70_01311 [Pomacea canaliculata]